jgi:hypothetical protein
MDAWEIKDERADGSSQQAGMTFSEFLSFGFPQSWADWSAASQDWPPE